MPAPDYENARFNLKRQIVREGIRVSENKIRSYCDEGGYDIQMVRERIKNDEMFRWFFVKDPIRQNFYENLFLEWFTEIEGVRRPIQLGGNELRLFEGEILNQNDVRTRNVNPPCKSIDFSFEHNGNMFYVYHKYAKEAGGHQDNQYQDLQCFIEEANKVNIPHTFFLAIADGNFWSTRNGRANMTKMQRLQELSNKTTVFALSSNELITMLETIPSNETT